MVNENNKFAYKINFDDVSYIGTYEKDKCKVEDLKNSQYLTIHKIVDDKEYFYQIPLKYTYKKDDGFYTNFVRDLEYYIYERKLGEKKGEGIKVSYSKLMLILSL